MRVDRPRYLGVSALVLVLACATPPDRSEGRDAPSVVLDTLLLSPVGSEEFMSLSERTTTRLHLLGWHLWSYEERHKRLPDSLADVVPAPHNAFTRRVLTDAWDNPIIWVPAQDSVILRSPGPDRVPGTADDAMVVVLLRDSRILRLARDSLP